MKDVRQQHKQKVASWINSLTSHTEGQIVVTVIWPFSYHYRAKYTVLINCTQWYSITGNYSISRIISCVISQFRSLFWCKQHLEMIFTLKTFTVSLESMIYFSILIWKHLYTEIWFTQDFIPLESILLFCGVGWLPSD